jgi:hypothetical protein
MLNINKDSQFKTQKELRQLAPSIFTKKGSNDTSEKYIHIPTDRVIQDMETLGWGVIDAKEVKARKQVGFQKHLIVFRNEDIMVTGDDGDVIYPQILLTNSHDGKNAFTFTAGMFRMICENGLVVCSQEFENLKIRHYGYNLEVLQETIKSIVEKLPLTVESMNKFKTIELKPKQAVEFAKLAVGCRFTEEEIENVEIDWEDLLTPTRPEDKGNNLWSILNVVQEKLVHGMFNYTTGTKIRKARKIKNFKQDMILNEKLWAVAEEFCN